MLVGIDGACMKNGKPDCVSCGAAFIIDEVTGEEVYYSRVEKESTSQRGELMGLTLALEQYLNRLNGERSMEYRSEPCIIITDSEYLYNSVSKEWCFKWENNDWKKATGEPTANIDLWTTICCLLHELETIEGAEVQMQWTKGHLMSTLSVSKAVHMMIADPTGSELYHNITTLINRISDKERIAADFNRHRTSSGQLAVPEDIALLWCSLNVMADYVAATIIKGLKAELNKNKQEELHNGKQ